MQAAGSKNTAFQSFLPAFAFILGREFFQAFKKVVCRDTCMGLYCDPLQEPMQVELVLVSSYKFVVEHRYFGSLCEKPR